MLFRRGSGQVVSSTRLALDRFCDEKIDVDGLAAEFPHCACENADTPDGSPGIVADKEMVRLFLTSPSHLRVKKPADMAKERKFRPADLKRAYNVGLSVCRLSHASSEELRHTMAILHDIQVAANGKIGGLVGVADFPVTAVRSCPDPHVPMCVHQTPLDHQRGAVYLRPSHADVVNSQSGMSDEAQKASRDIIFNQIMDQGEVLGIKDVSGIDMTSFAPKTGL